jgi:type II secretory pathway component PulF
MEFVIISCAGLLLLFLAVLVRIVEYCQPDSYKSDGRRKSLRRASVIMFSVSLFCMVAMFGFGVIFLFLVVLFIEADIRTSGLRHRAWQAEFMWVLAIAVKSGRPLADEIEAYAEGTWGKRHQQLVDMAIRLRHGESLLEINETQELLPQSAVLQIYSGISAKSLQDSLGTNAIRLTQELVDDQETGFIGASLLYPAALLIFMGLVTSFVMYYIIPKFKKIFDDFGTELPGMTVLLIKISDRIVNYWYIFGLPFILAPFAVVLFVSYAEYYGWRDILRLAFGRWFVRLYSSDVLRSLSLWIKQGQPIDESLLTIVQNAGPKNLRTCMFQASQSMKMGSPCWQSLQDVGILKPRETAFLESAQQAGNLPWALNTLAETIENRRMFRFRTVLEFVQPFALFTMSMIVGFVVISLFMPLVKLLNDLS